MNRTFALPKPPFFARSTRPAAGPVATLLTPPSAPVEQVEIDRPAVDLAVADRPNPDRIRLDAPHRVHVDWAAVDWAAVDWAAVDWAAVDWTTVDGAGSDGADGGWVANLPVRSSGAAYWP